MNELHRCEPGFDFSEGEMVFCSGGTNGAAITRCMDNGDGRLWVGNSEYSNQVNYCPFCGFRARVQVEWSPGIQVVGANQSLVQAIENATDGDIIYIDCFGGDNAPNPFLVFVEHMDDVGQIMRQIDTGEIKSCDLCNKRPVGCVRYKRGMLALCREHVWQVNALILSFDDGKEPLGWLTRCLRP